MEGGGRRARETDAGRETKKYRKSGVGDTGEEGRDESGWWKKRGEVHVPRRGGEKRGQETFSTTKETSAKASDIICHSYALPECFLHP
jgi:hypothetical protein